MRGAVDTVAGAAVEGLQSDGTRAPDGSRHSGVRVEAMSRDPFALCRWSRWARQLHRCPASGTDPAGYLQAVSAVLAEGGFDALLPTHEQAWLFAVGRDRLPAGAPLALAPAAAFGRVQSKA